MKRLIVFLLLVLVLALAGIVYAQHMHGMAPMTKTSPSIDIENLKKFQRETLSLRDDLMTKRLELRNEYNKPERDYDKIASLRKEIVDLKTKIEAIADKYGVKDMRGVGRMMADGMGGPMMRGGMMGRMGCPCPMCQ